MKEVTINELNSYINDMKTEINPKIRACIDGRYKANQASGAISIPGADLGISFALLKLGVSPKESFELVYEFVRTFDGNYCWHSDSHESDDDCYIGCGHCDYAIKSAEEFGVSKEDGIELLNIVRKAQEERDHMDLIYLDGDHNERAVLIVEDEKFTLKPQSDDETTQFFIYDSTAHEKFLHSFSTFITAQKGYNFTTTQLLTASIMHGDTTLSLLGSSDHKQVFTISNLSEEVEISFLGKVNE